MQDCGSGNLSRPPRLDVGSHLKLTAFLLAILSIALPSSSSKLDFLIVPLASQRPPSSDRSLRQVFLRGGPRPLLHLFSSHQTKPVSKTLTEERAFVICFLTPFLAGTFCRSSRNGLLSHLPPLRFSLLHPSPSSDTTTRSLVPSLVNKMPLS